MCCFYVFVLYNVMAFKYVHFKYVSGFEVINC